MTPDQSQGRDRNLVTRRSFLKLGVAAGAAFALPVLVESPVATATENPYKQAAIKLSEITINIVKNEAGQVISEQRTVEDGNDYFLSLTQQRGSERMQGLRARILADGTSRERVKVVKQDGTIEYRNEGDTYVFKGKKDVSVNVREICAQTSGCKEELKDGMNIDIFRIRRGNRLELFMTVPVAFDCNPRLQSVADTIITQEQSKPSAPAEVPATPTSPKPPVQAPVQLPRSSVDPSLQEEFGTVAVLAAGQLERVIHE